MKPHRFALAALLAATALGSATTLAQSDPTGEGTAQGDLSVTIYNNGQSLVQDIRRLDIARGRSTISFPDVSAMIRPETLSFNAANTTIVEQNFDFDLLTPQKLMEKAVGQEVTLIRTNPATGAETMERAEVLSTVGGVVVRIDGRIEVLRDDGLPVRVIFDRVPPNLRARPTLSVSLESSRGGTRDASIRYLTPGLGWSSDYVALFDERNNTVDMQGWVTLTNTTGTTFTQADTLLVAGNVSGGGRGRPRTDLIEPGTETAERERLGDYYLYPIEGRTTIANNQTKQVSFLDVQGVPAQRVYSIGSSWLQSDRAPRNASSAISFSSSREGGLGDALPAGVVRFYQRDSEGNPQFIGENSIGHTPMGSVLSLRTGDAFDVFMQAEVESRDVITAAEYRNAYRYRVIEDGEVTREVDVQRSVDYYRTTMRYTFTNAKPEPVVVELTQGGLDRGWWARDFQITSEDVEGEQLNAGNRLYRVTVPANGERVVRVTYQTKY
ncbi:DUF4139 domain-containing protein [Alteraurantiacibacter aquimixticola]|uniref:DUF4139 domain-containing protein n=1 Tax=Alteraurantiacibacter aquimixticola TaxID=2489173 RepID=A0A4T3F2N5_9SPHN|nr:DUF4139 domain-containing protein [Alteraurantiacibacter aquimixticola]TIX50350.1 DUF4139 domain-containing protein [Alteraurantiacibacter aquimixticola]